MAGVLHICMPLFEILILLDAVSNALVFCISGRCVNDAICAACINRSLLSLFC